jgi:hypothetical protein
MKIVVKILIILVVCVFSTKNFAQTDIGYAHIRIENAKKPLCKVDDSIAFNFNEARIKLTPGKHNIKIWMPYTTLIDSTIYVKSKDTSMYIFRVKYAPRYTKYLNDYSNYRQVKKLRWFVSPTLIGLSIGGAILANDKANGYVRKALQNREEYLHAGAQSTIDGYEASFNENKKKYKNFTAIEIGMYSMAGVLTANYIRLLIKQHHTIPPKYKEDILLSRISINAYPDFASRKWLMGLSINF